MPHSNFAIARACPATIEKAAKKRLNNTGYRSLRSVRCRFDDGTLTLKGEVPLYYHKQIAQEAIRKVGDFKAIVNDIDVSS
jgi:hypothetical protein